jgi:hypothetical protein
MTKCCQYVKDAAPYATQAMGPFQALLHKMTYITCLTYGLYRTVERVYSNIPNINSFIASLKK